MAMTDALPAATSNVSSSCLLRMAQLLGRSLDEAGQHGLHSSPGHGLDDRLAGPLCSSGSSQLLCIYPELWILNPLKPQSARVCGRKRQAA